VPPKIKVNPARESIIDVGKNLTLTCRGYGNPTPTITWTKDGVSQRQFKVSGNELRLVNVQRKDVGSYRCTASNGYGNDTVRVSIVGLSCKYYKSPTFSCESILDFSVLSLIFHHKGIHTFSAVHLSSLKRNVKCFHF